MKVLGNLPVEKDSSSDYPFGANIQNETDTVSGTPVVREIYGDVLMNIYRLLELANITPTNTEDNGSTQYQIVEALKKLPNSLNDIEQVLTLTGSVWSVPFDLSILPNKYFFIARASHGYVNATTFKGTGVLELPFSSSGFNASDELLVIIDSLGVRAYSLTKLIEAPTFLNTIISTPIRYTLGNELFYLDSGKLYKNLQVWDLQNLIRVDQSDGALILQNAFIMQGHIVCVVKNPSTVNYEFYAFDLLDLNTVIGLTTDWVQTPSVDYLPEFYANNQYMFVSNKANTSANDYEFYGLVFDPNINLLFFSYDVDFGVSYNKTSNGTVLNDVLYILNSGVISYFDINNGAGVVLGNFTALSGHLFSLGGALYLNQTSIAHKLDI